MTNRSEDYSEKITKLSQQLLQSITTWAQQTKAKPYLVGGWAVYYHLEKSNAGFQVLGSKDIDLVFKNADDKQKFERDFCKPNNIHKRQPNPFNLFDFPRYIKAIQETDIIIDTDTLASTWTTNEAKMSWTPLLENSESVPVNKLETLSMPTKELLILYKSAAFIDRNTKEEKEKKRYYESKIWKDAQDILALTKTGYDPDKISNLAADLKWAPMLKASKKLLNEKISEYGLEKLAANNPYVE